MAEPEYDNGICSVQPKRAEAGLHGSLRNQAAEGESFTPTEVHLVGTSSARPPPTPKPQRLR